MASVFPSQVGDLLSFIEETSELSGLLGAASVIGLLWSGCWLFQTMEFVFNHFYGTPDRGYREQVLMAVAMMVLYAALFTLSVLAPVTETFLVAVSDRAVPLDLAGFDPVIGWLLALGSAVVMFLAIYRVIPNTPLRLADVWPGALLAGVLFVLLSQVFPLYLRILGGSYAAYRTLGLFLMLTTWFYCLAVILVLGVELNAFLGGRGGAVQRGWRPCSPSSQRHRRLPIVHAGVAIGRHHVGGRVDVGGSVVGDRRVGRRPRPTDTPRVGAPGRHPRPSSPSGSHRVRPAPRFTGL
jgi:YihY family inner membrane protein